MTFVSLLAAFGLFHATKVYADNGKGDPGGIKTGCDSTHHTMNTVYPATDAHGTYTGGSVDQSTVYIYAETYYCGGGQNPPQDITYGNYSGGYCVGNCPIPNRAIKVEVDQSDGAGSFVPNTRTSENKALNIGDINSAKHYEEGTFGYVKFTSGCITIKVTYGVGATYGNQKSSNGNQPAKSFFICRVVHDHAPSGDVSVACTTLANGVASYSFTYFYYDADGYSADPAQGYLSSSVYGADGSHSFSTEKAPSSTSYHGHTATYTWPANSWPGTVGGVYHAVALRSRDVVSGPDKWVTVDNVSQPNCNSLGTIASSCTTDANGTPTYTLSGTFNDPDGFSGAPSRIYLVSSKYGEEAEDDSSLVLYYVRARTPYDHDTFSWTTHTWPTGYNIELHVMDIYGGGWEYKAQAGQPGCPPGGTVTASCSGVNVSNASDPDLPNHKLRIDVYEDGAAGTGKRVYSAYTSVDSLGHNTGDMTAPWQSPDDQDILHGYKDPASPAGSGTTVMKPGVYPGITSHGLWVYIIGLTSAGVESGNTFYTRTAGPCITVNCNAQTLDADLVAGHNASFTVSVKITGATIGDLPTPIPAFPVTVKNPSGIPQALTPASPVPYDPAATTTAGTTIVLYSQTINFTPTTTGVYTVNYQWPTAGFGATNNTIPMVCGSSSTAGFAPYFKVSGGDVVAGDTFKNSGSLCAPLSGASAAAAGIKSWNNDNSPASNYFGAGTNLAAFALGDIKSFVTASDGVAGVSNVGTPVAHPYALAFANGYGASADDTGSYGGSYGAYPNCDSDYFTDSYDTNPANEFSGGSMPLPDPATPATRSYSGNVTLTGGVLSSGHHLTMIVNGDVFINGDLNYGVYATADDIPSLTIYAKGGIYVAGNVHLIHATLVAQGGPFATCTNGSSSPAGETTDFATCSTKATPLSPASLDVYGSVSAKSVNLDRTYGSYGTNTGPAESFHYTPETWIPGATGALCAGAGGCKYDSISGLPPVL